MAQKDERDDDEGGTSDSREGARHNAPAHALRRSLFLGEAGVGSRKGLLGS